MMKKYTVKGLLAIGLVALTAVATEGTASAMRPNPCAVIYHTYHTTTDPDVGFDMANRWMIYCGDYDGLEP